MTFFLSDLNPKGTDSEVKLLVNVKTRMNKKLRPCRYIGRTHPYARPHVDSCHKICVISAGLGPLAALDDAVYASSCKNWEGEIAGAKSITERSLLVC